MKIAYFLLGALVTAGLVIAFTEGISHGVEIQRRMPGAYDASMKATEETFAKWFGPSRMNN